MVSWEQWRRLTVMDREEYRFKIDKWANYCYGGICALVWGFFVSFGLFVVINIQLFTLIILGKTEYASLLLWFNESFTILIKVGFVPFGALLAIGLMWVLVSEQIFLKNKLR
jgi:hypothetical protein